MWSKSSGNMTIDTDRRYLLSHQSFILLPAPIGLKKSIHRGLGCA